MGGGGGGGVFFLLDRIGFYWVSLGCDRFDCVVQCKWARLGFTGFFWVLIGFYWVLLGLTKLC